MDCEMECILVDRLDGHHSIPNSQEPYHCPEAAFLERWSDRDNLAVLPACNFCRARWSDILPAGDDMYSTAEHNCSSDLAAVPRNHTQHYCIVAVAAGRDHIRLVGEVVRSGLGDSN